MLGRVLGMRAVGGSGSLLPTPQLLTFPALPPALPCGMLLCADGEHLAATCSGGGGGGGGGSLVVHLWEVESEGRHVSVLQSAAGGGGVKGEVEVEGGVEEGTVAALCWHPRHVPLQLLTAASPSSGGGVYVWAKAFEENWSAFAPDFSELADNRCVWCVWFGVPLPHFAPLLHLPPCTPTPHPHHAKPSPLVPPPPHTQIKHSTPHLTGCTTRPRMSTT